MSSIKILESILANAPEGATHVDRANHYWKFIGEFGDFLMCDQEGGWVGGFSPIITRSLANIKRIVELEKERESLLRLISYVKSIVFSKVKCSYVSFKRPLEELLKD